MARRVGPLTRERRRELTRTALIEAAADLFARRGFHATSLEEIAHAAGFTRGAIYKNFRSKEEILLAVVEWNIDLQLAAYSDVLEAAPEESSDRATAAAEVWAHFFRRDPTLILLELEIRLHALRDPNFRPRLVEWERQWRERIAQFVGEQVRHARLRLPIPPADFAAFALAGVEGLSFAAAVHADESERYDRLVEFFFRLVSQAIKPEDGDDTRPTRASRRSKTSTGRGARSPDD